MKYTLFKNTKGKLCKHINSDGSKTSHALLQLGTYKICNVNNLKEFHEGLNTLSSSQAIGLGIPTDKISAGVITTQNDLIPGSIARSKKYFEWNEEKQILLFDYDFFDEMNEQMKIETPEEYRNLLIKLDDRFSDAEMLIVPSSSSGIYNKNSDKVILDSNGMHCYVIVNNQNKIDLWIENLFQKAWEKGLACIKFSKDGKQLARTIFDKAVFSPERLIFEARPTLDEGLIQKTKDPLYIAGSIIDINNEISIKRETHKNEKKAYDKTNKQSNKIRAEYTKDKIQELIDQGTPEEDARAFVKARCENGQIEKEDTIILADGTNVLAKNLSIEHAGVYCLDPIEPSQANAIINVYADGSVMIYSFLHGGRKFYVKDEKFEHKSLPKKHEPIDPKLYIDTFSKKWEGYNNIVSPALQETWGLNCLAMNNATEVGNTKYIVPAVTGSGKTEGIITYCSLLPKDVTVVISTNLIIEADRIAEAINNESEKVIASSFHSKNDLSIDDASKFQIVVVSHEFYRRHYEGDEKWEKLGDRDLIIIDEALDTMKEITVTEKDIDMVIQIVKELLTWHRYKGNQNIEHELKMLQSDYNCLIQTPTVLGKGTKLINSEKMSKIKIGTFDPNVPDEYKDLSAKEVLKDKYQYTKSAIMSDENIRYNKILTTVNSVSNDKQIQYRILETLSKLEMFPGEQLYVSANQGQYSYHKVIDNTPNHNLVCFDATADVNKIYDYRAEYHGDLIKIPKIEGTRDYSNVNLYIARKKTGKSAIDTSYIEQLMSDIELGEKTLLVTHKANESLFMSYIDSSLADKYIEVAHWGALTGLNTWQDFDTCVVIGLNHKPSYYTQNRVIVSTNEDTAFGETQHYLGEEITITDIVAEIIQAINRIRIRKIININGGCLSANIYLTLPLYNTKKYESLIKAQMPGINIIKWSTSCRSEEDREENQGYLPAIIDYLKNSLNGSDEISINEPRDALYIQKDSYRKIIGKVNFKQSLEENSFEIVLKTELDKHGRKRKRPSKYIRKIK